MNVLLLSRYPRNGASSRIRFYQYLDHLRRAGIHVTVAPLFGDRHLARRGGDFRGAIGALTAGYAGRLARLFRLRRFDLLWIEAELFPGLPAWPEMLLARIGVPYVVDYDDAVFHKYDRTSSRARQWLLGSKVDHVMRRAALVVVGNEYLASRARKAGARHIERIPSVVDLNRYPLSPGRPGNTVTIGWIGSWSTTKYLQAVVPALNEVCRDPAIRLTLVGAEAAALNGVTFDARPWSEGVEVEDIQSFDIGIMPLDDGPWERGKCGYKLIQYMACGRPAVASPVGANRDIIRHGVNGFHATTTPEWVAALRQLSEDPRLREYMGVQGRKDVEQRYSIGANVPRLRDALLAAAGTGRSLAPGSSIVPT
jgi:glycosyltransferase involved in cell wall biosynthesis